MKYNSIGEYFYKLSNRCLGLILLPVLVVLGLYLGFHFLIIKSDSLFITHLIGIQLITLELGILTILLLFMLLFVNQRATRLKKEPSLGVRMVGYIAIVMIRSWILSAMLLVCGGLSFLTGNLRLLYPLLAIAILYFFYWPTPDRMATDLLLKPDEKKIMKNKKLGT